MSTKLESLLITAIENLESDRRLADYCAKSETLTLEREYWRGQYVGLGIAIKEIKFALAEAQHLDGFENA